MIGEIYKSDIKVVLNSLLKVSLGFCIQTLRKEKVLYSQLIKE